MSAEEKQLVLSLCLRLEKISTSTDEDHLRVDGTISKHILRSLYDAALGGLTHSSRMISPPTSSR